jgi:hypothetical protein
MFTSADIEEVFVRDPAQCFTANCLYLEISRLQKGSESGVEVLVELEPHRAVTETGITRSRVTSAA